MSWLDNYPYTNFHEMNLDWLLTQMRRLISDWDAYKAEMDLKYETLHDELEALKKYVDDYFDNLDVEGIIKDQIQELLDDGTITDMVLSLLSTDYLPIVDDTTYGSLLLGTRGLQGFDAFVFNATNYMFVCATDSTDHAEYRLINLDTNVIEKDVIGIADCHANDCTYADGFVYVAGFSDTNIYKIKIPDMTLEETIDMSTFGQVNGIAYNSKKQQFFINFRASNLNDQIFIFNSDFTLDRQITIKIGSMAKQGLYVDSEYGRLYVIKYRTAVSFRFPTGNRINAYTLNGEYLATTYLNSTYELEGITKVGDRYVFGVYINDGGVRSGIFTIGALQRDEGLTSNYLRTLLNQNSYKGNANNVYFNANHQYFFEDGGEDNPFKSLAGLKNCLRSWANSTLYINLRSNMPYLEISDYDRHLWVKGGEYNIAGMLFRRCGTLTIEGGIIAGFDARDCRNVHVFGSTLTGEVITKTTAIVQYDNCNFTGVTGKIDLADNGTARVYDNTYGNTEASAAGTMLRPNERPNYDEQWAFRNANASGVQINAEGLQHLWQIEMFTRGGLNSAQVAALDDMPSDFPANQGAFYIKLPMAGVCRCCILSAGTTTSMWVRIERHTVKANNPSLSAWKRII